MNGLTVAEIHERLEERSHKASRRTIYRDLDALLKAGFPLYEEGQGETLARWKLNRNPRINQYLALTARQLFALFLARGAVSPLKQTPFYEDLKEIFTRLSDRLGDRQVEYLRALENEVRFEPGPAWGLGINPEILETIRSACAEGQILEGVYFSVNSETERNRKLGPHYLYYAQGGLYLVAEDLDDRKVKVFALPRFRNAMMLDQPYLGKVSTPESFFNGGMAIYNGTPPEEIVIEFEKKMAHFVKERCWHPTQRVKSLERGRVEVRFELGNTPELLAWILGFGASAKVIAPKSLAETVRRAALETAEVYA